MRKLDNTNFEQANIEYVQFWLMNPFLDPDNPNTEGGDFYLNFGEVSEDILGTDSKATKTAYPTTATTSFSKKPYGDACRARTPLPTHSTTMPARVWCRTSVSTA